jgi:hypothetical protein
MQKKKKSNFNKNKRLFSSLSLLIVNVKEVSMFGYCKCSAIVQISQMKNALS